MIRYFLGHARSENVEHINICDTSNIVFAKRVYNIVHGRSSQTRERKNSRNIVLFTMVRFSRGRGAECKDDHSQNLSTIEFVWR